MFKIEYDSSPSGYMSLLQLLTLMPTAYLRKFCPNPTGWTLGYIPGRIVSLGNQHVRHVVQSGGTYAANLALFKEEMLTPDLATRFNPVSEEVALQTFFELDSEWLPLLEQVHNNLKRLRYMYCIDPIFFESAILDIHCEGYALDGLGTEALGGYQYNPNGYSCLNTIGYSISCIP